MIYLLDRFLPMELTDKIYRELHKSLMRDICEIINHKIVFTMYWGSDCSSDSEPNTKPFNIETGKISFLICENQNYYKCLEDFKYVS
tara:strand:+ start:382 stop:642 length:261 start_codon:yes stop_codon:yes gene_type:complete